MTTITVDRQKWLHQLESVSPGLASKGAIEQANCFIFEGDTVRTYNDEIACISPCLVNLQGAVQAQVLLDLLRRLKEDTLVVIQKEGEIVVKGKNRKCGIRYEKEITLPGGDLVIPKSFKKFGTDFLEGVELVRHCVSTDESKPALSCISFSGAKMEASDGYQCGKYELKESVSSENFLVHGSALKHVLNLGMRSIAVTDKWVLFRNKSEVILATRKVIDEWPALDKFYEVVGNEVILPKGVGEAIERAVIMAEEIQEVLYVKVELEEGSLRLSGSGSLGWYTEKKKVSYKGAPLAFLIRPDLLKRISESHNECQVSKDRLKVSVGSFSYITVLAEMVE